MVKSWNGFPWINNNYLEMEMGGNKEIKACYGNKTSCRS